MQLRDWTSAAHPDEFGYETDEAKKRIKGYYCNVSNVKSKCEKTASDMETVKSHHYKLAELSRRH